LEEKTSIGYYHFNNLLIVADAAVLTTSTIHRFVLSMYVLLLTLLCKKRQRGRGGFRRAFASKNQNKELLLVSLFPA